MGAEGLDLRLAGSVGVGLCKNGPGGLFRGLSQIWPGVREVSV